MIYSYTLNYDKCNHNATKAWNSALYVTILQFLQQVI